jgi:hypothetical protein
MLTLSTEGQGFKGIRRLDIRWRRGVADQWNIPYASYMLLLHVSEKKAHLRSRAS